MRRLNRPVFCRLFLLPLAAGLFFAADALAADDVTARAMKLYEKHHYEEALHLLQPELAAMDNGRQTAASLALGMLHLENARLYRGLQQTAQVIELDYLTQLSRQKNGAASRYVDLYLGQMLVETGKAAEGAAHLQKFAEQSGHPLARTFAGIELGIAYSRQKQAQKAAQAWAGVDLSKPEIKAALAGAYAASGALEHKPSAMADAAMNDARAQRYVPGTRMLRNLLRAYSQSGDTEKALAILNASEFREASYVEDLGASKAISFYDASLFEDMARTHLRAAVMYLEQAGKDAKLGSTASFFLIGAYLQQGNAEQALRTAGSFLSQAPIPPQYRDLALAYQAMAQYRTGKHAEAGVAWQSLAEKSAQDPALLAEVVQLCGQAGADCGRLEKQALAAVENGEGKKYFPLNAALGKYYLQRKDYRKAVQYMEAGRDKANKNKIEANDPLLLVALAEAYYRNKNFSENLEIYFELGKQYPVVRQIQEAMQGIYSLEHQSAGDVKIF
jgi:hypothetical protein